MSIPVSSSPAVRAYLYSQFTAQLTPDPNNPSASLLVCYDEPGPNQPDDIVAVGKVHRTIEPGEFVGGGGAGWLRERYRVEITVDVYRGGDDAQAVYQRAADLLATCISIVRTDLTLGGNVITGRPESDSIEVEWDEGHMGYHALGTLELSCYQRI